MPPTYQQMYDQADLVAIAQPIATNTTPEQMLLPNISPDIPVAGVETQFAVQTLLKGDKAATTRFILHHYREVKHVNYMNAPELVAFQPTNREPFLVFVKKEADGRFAPIYNQTDPGMAGIESMRIIDLIAIAKPVTPKIQTDKKMLPGVTPVVQLMGYQTEFAVTEVLAGDPTTKRIVLHHYERLSDYQCIQIDFQPDTERLYLLILKKDAQGQYGPISRFGVSGAETMPTGFSIIQLPHSRQ